MDNDAKKTALRMIPYGLYVLTVEAADGTVAASTVNWVSQTSFEPPLLVVAIKADSLTHSLVKDNGVFALNMLGKGQQGQAFTFFKSLEREGNNIGGEPFTTGNNGAPILTNLPAFVECRVVEFLEKGDHSTVIAEVIDAGLKGAIDGRPDEAILHLKELGEKVFYGG